MNQAMKKLLLLVLVLISLVSCSTGYKSADNKIDNSSEKVDLTGAYRGLMPCADCEGIRTEIVLDEKGRYTISRVYVGKRGSRSHNSGFYKYDGSSGVVYLTDKKGGVEGSYLYKEGNLVMLDGDGKRVEGELANMYVLERAVEYDLMVFDVGFDHWLKTNPITIDHYSNEYLQTSNIRYVQEWNRRYINGDKRIESYVDYNPSEKYNKDFNFKLFMYFKYFEETNGMRLR